jgi:DNA-binding PadR family transcriptional regulator
MRVTKVELVVLGLLSDGPAHGYALLDRLRERGMPLWTELGRASVYQALDRLERRGLVQGRAVGGAAGPDRRVMRLTGAGRTLLHAGIEERAGEAGPYDTPAGLALGFLDTLTPSGARDAVGAYEHGLQERLSALRAARAATADPRAAVLLARQEALVKADLAWVRSHREALLSRS